MACKEPRRVYSRIIQHIVGGNEPFVVTSLDTLFGGITVANLYMDGNAGSFKPNSQMTAANRMEYRELQYNPLPAPKSRVQIFCRVQDGNQNNIHYLQSDRNTFQTFPNFPDIDSARLNTIVEDITDWYTKAKKKDSGAAYLGTVRTFCERILLLWTYPHKPAEPTLLGAFTRAVERANAQGPPSTALEAEEALAPVPPKKGRGKARVYDPKSRILNSSYVPMRQKMAVSLKVVPGRKMTKETRKISNDQENALDNVNESTPRVVSDDDDDDPASDGPASNGVADVDVHDSQLTQSSSLIRQTIPVDVKMVPGSKRTKKRTLNGPESSDDELPSDPPANFDLGTIPIADVDLNESKIRASKKPRGEARTIEEVFHPLHSVTPDRSTATAPADQMTKKRVRTLNRQESSDDDLPSDPPANVDLGTFPAPADNLDSDMTLFVHSQTGVVVTPDSLHKRYM
jgi:hypothetical protein